MFVDICLIINVLYIIKDPIYVEESTFIICILKGWMWNNIILYYIIIAILYVEEI